MAVWDRINASFPRPSYLKKTALSFLHNTWLLLSSLPAPGPTLGKTLRSVASLLVIKCPGSIESCLSPDRNVLSPAFLHLFSVFIQVFSRYPSHFKLPVEYLEDTQMLTKQTKPESHHPRMIINLGRLSLLVFSLIKVHSKRYEIHIAL